MENVSTCQIVNKEITPKDLININSFNRPMTKTCPIVWEILFSKFLWNTFGAFILLLKFNKMQKVMQND